MKVLGISGLYHDSAACLVDGPTIVAAAQEERFTRVKSDSRFPAKAIQYCLEEAELDMKDVDAVVYYENPLLTLDRTVEAVKLTTYEELSGEHFRRLDAVFTNRLWVEEQLRALYPSIGKFDELLCVDHHLSHAASAFYPSPYSDAAILTTDGVGEWATLTIGHGRGSEIHLEKQMNYPNSIGLLYSAFTSYCGFKVNSGEYKMMGLAPYGQARFVDKIKTQIVEVFDDGSINLNLAYFDFLDQPKMISDMFSEVFGSPPRERETELTQHYMDVAASIQAVLEEIILRLAKTAKKLYGSQNLVIAGGVGLNSAANGLLRRSEVFENIWIQPAAGDAGGALGAALHVMYSRTGLERRVGRHDGQNGSFLGPDFSQDEIRLCLDLRDCQYEEAPSRDSRNNLIARYLEEGKVIGLFQGRLEFGPRALGHRSIIGDPRNSEMQSRMNLQIKYRESFRPFAPSVLAEKCAEYFNFEGDSPYMLLVESVLEDRRISLSREFWHDGKDLREYINEPRSDIPAVTHVDYSARLHTVEKTQNAEFYDVIQAFYQRTGCAVVINTSFNVRGEPIVCNPDDAINCFLKTDMDVLVLEDFVLLKDEQPLRLVEIARENEVGYELD